MPWPGKMSSSARADQPARPAVASPAPAGCRMHHPRVLEHASGWGRARAPGRRSGCRARGRGGRRSGADVPAARLDPCRRRAAACRPGSASASTCRPRCGRRRSSISPTPTARSTPASASTAPKLLAMPVRRTASPAGRVPVTPRLRNRASGSGDLGSGSLLTFASISLAGPVLGVDRRRHPALGRGLQPHRQVLLVDDEQRDIDGVGHLLAGQRPAAPPRRRSRPCRAPRRARTCCSRPAAAASPSTGPARPAGCP